MKQEGIFMRARFLTLGSVLAALALAAMAQDAPPPDQGGENDPPSRAARLSFIQGTVSFQPGSVEDWVLK